MAHDLWARLTQQTDDPFQNPNIGKHAFFSALREYARGQLSVAQIVSNYNIGTPDAGASSILNLIDNEIEEQNKLNKIREIEDLLIMHEGNDSNDLYPSKNAIKNRLGI